ncbi:MAG: class II aldolase/adducin family protein [Spirochaetia bacterium]|nr:class II aldolase/adducin family protein [Spirochaetota bacterium]MCX8096723.1 class II aldolase/adducin family protein [Spirochaetota bacterium]MDW8112170.1 class II aldolase/adducin family protein [Spirochaetia bacterium]
MEELIREIVEVSKLMYKKGYITSKEGNLSYRVEDKIVITPSGTPKFNLKEEDIVVVSIDDLKRGVRGNASSEVFTHLECYLTSEDVKCVLHAHPENTIVLDLLGYNFKTKLLAEAEYFLGDIYVTEYATPGTPEGANVVRGVENDIIILHKHGVIIKSKTNLWDAFYRLEILEKYSGIVYKYLLAKNIDQVL